MIPKDCKWSFLLKRAAIVERFGFGNEWARMLAVESQLFPDLATATKPTTASDGTIPQLLDEKPKSIEFWRNTTTFECAWERPPDAIVVKQKERFCAAYQVRPSDHNLFSMNIIAVNVMRLLLCRIKKKHRYIVGIRVNNVIMH